RSYGGEGIRGSLRQRLPQVIDRAEEPFTLSPKPILKWLGSPKQSPGTARTPSRTSRSQKGRLSLPSANQGKQVVPPAGATQDKMLPALPSAWPKTDRFDDATFFSLARIDARLRRAWAAMASDSGDPLIVK